MPEPFLDDLAVHALGEPEGGARVAEVVEDEVTERDVARRRLLPDYDEDLASNPEDGDE